MHFHRNLIVKGLPSPDGGTQQFRLLQLNTLAHWACDGETDEEYEQRTVLHLQHIEALRPSIVVLEEVDGPLTAPPTVPTLPQRLINSGIYNGVSAGKNNEKGDETWVLYRNDAAAVSTSLKNDEKEGAISHFTVIRFDDGTSSQFAICVKLRVTAIDTDVIVVGHHAKAGRTEENETTRICHSTELWRRLCALYAQDDAFLQGRLLLCGDFNAGPHSYEGKYPASWYPSIVEGLWGAEGGLVSAQRSLVGAEGEAQSVTTFKLRKGAWIEQCIDYVFHNPSGLAACGGLQLPCQLTAAKGVEEVNAAPTPHALLPQEGLPKVGLWGSDHLSIAFDFRKS